MHKKFNLPPIDTSKVKTYSIKERKSKVGVSNFSNVEQWRKTGNIKDLFPSILKAKDLIEVADRVVSAHKKNKPVIFAMGAHVIKCGLNPILIDLIKKKIISAVAMNGAGSVHDYEIAYHGSTSEVVEKEIKNGKFGMAEETGFMINDAINRNVDEDIGMGESLGLDMAKKDLPYNKNSIIYNCFKEKIPVTLHVAVGTDISHLHPSIDAAKLGKSTYNDFKLFSSVIATLGDGGCFFNIGSSVILPEIFLKALTLTRNLGYSVNNFTTVNMDMVQHYRPNINVVARPTQDDGQGYSITGHHEIMLPLLYTIIIEKMEAENT